VQAAEFLDLPSWAIAQGAELLFVFVC